VRSENGILIAVIGTGGVLKGTGTVVGNVQNAGGTFAPGGSAGVFHVDGDWTQEAGGTLEIEIGGYAPGTEYDQLAISGAAHLGGVLAVTLLNGFVPAVNRTFDVVTYAEHTGDFTEVRLPVGVPGRRFEVRTGVTSVTLLVGPGADLDGNGKADIVDHSVFVSCMGGPGVPVSDYCQVADLDGDGDVDLGDFEVFEGLMDGV
jgi:hypothetical protein